MCASPEGLRLDLHQEQGQEKEHILGSGFAISLEAAGTCGGDRTTSAYPCSYFFPSNATKSTSLEL